MRVLFVFSIINYYREMLPVAEFFYKMGCDVHVLFGWKGSSADESIRYCKSIGFKVYVVPEKYSYGDFPNIEIKTKINEKNSHVVIGYALSIKNAFCVFLNNLTPQFVVYLKRSFKNYISLLECIRFADKLCNDIDPIVVLGGPFHSFGQRFDDAIAKRAKTGKKLYCCLTVSAYWGKEQAILARFKNLEDGMLPRLLECDYSFFHRVVAKLFPDWSKCKEGKSIFIGPPDGLLAAHCAGLLPPDVWQKPTDDYDLVFAESEFSREMLVHSGYPSEKIVVAGKPLLDVVFANLLDQIYIESFRKNLGLRGDEQFILFNVEPSAEHHYSSWQDHWRRFHSMMTCLAKVSALHGIRVVLSLHPLCEIQDYLFVEKEYGFVISRSHKIGELYPHSRVVVSFACSTNLFSLIFKKQLIIYDFFEMTNGPDKYRTSLFRIPDALYAYNSDDVFNHLNSLLVAHNNELTDEKIMLSRVSASKFIYDYVKDKISYC